MPAFGEAQVIGRGVVLSDTEKGVVAGRRRDGGWGDRGCATSDDNRAGITSLKKHQARRDRSPGTVGGGYLASVRTSPPQGRGVDDIGRENTRFLQAECL